MEKESSGQRPAETKSTGGQGSRRAVAPSDDDDDVYTTVGFVDFCVKEM
jgi:hypothetical protein